MLNLTVTSGLDALIEELEEVEDRLFDLVPLAEAIRPLMIQDNLDGALGGLDRYGQSYVPIVKATIKWRQRTGRGAGPPLTPDGPASSLVSDYTVSIFEPQPGVVTLLGEWPLTPWVRYHADNGDARTHLPVRDPLGIRPSGWEAIEAEVIRFIEAL